jgi:hypothetical protein
MGDAMSDLNGCFRPEADIRESQISGKKKPAEAGFWNLH